MGIVPFDWALKKVLGPTLDEIGEDFRRVYVAGREKLIAAAQRKIDDIEDGRVANVRVAVDVLMNGAVAADDEICAEYFGGLLAASRTEDGKDDSLMPLVDAVKSLSSEQLRLHYYIYHGLNRLPWTSRSESTKEKTVFFPYVGTSVPGPDGDLSVLLHRGLIGSYTASSCLIRRKSDANESVVVYVSAQVTPFGKMVYAAAYNNLVWWRAIGSMRTEHHKDFPGVKLPDAYGFSLMCMLEDLLKENDWEIFRA